MQEFYHLWGDLVEDSSVVTWTIKKGPEVGRNHKWKHASIAIKSMGFLPHSNYAEVTSERTNLSPFTKDYRGAASWMRFFSFSVSLRSSYFYKQNLIIYWHSFYECTIDIFSRCFQDIKTICSTRSEVMINKIVPRKCEQFAGVVPANFSSKTKGKYIEKPQVKSVLSCNINPHVRSCSSYLDLFWCFNNASVVLSYALSIAHLAWSLSIASPITGERWDLNFYTPINFPSLILFVNACLIGKPASGKSVAL